MVSPCNNHALLHKNNEHRIRKITRNSIALYCLSMRGLVAVKQAGCHLFDIFMSFCKKVMRSFESTMTMVVTRKRQTNELLANLYFPEG